MLLTAALVLMITATMCTESDVYESAIKAHESAMCNYQHKIYISNLEGPVPVYNKDSVMIGEEVKCTFFWDRDWDFSVSDYKRARIGVYFFYKKELVSQYGWWSSDTTLRMKALNALEDVYNRRAKK